MILREDLIRTEYRQLHSVICDEEEQHLECVRNEGQCVSEKLRESEAMMVRKSKQLREMYQELMAMSQEPRVELLPVSMESGRKRLWCLRPTLVPVRLRQLSTFPEFMSVAILSVDNLKKLNSLVILKGQALSNCVSKSPRNVSYISVLRACFPEAQIQ